MKNHLRVTVRNLRNCKTFSFINIIGLAVGVARCIAILPYVRKDGILFDARLLLLTPSTVS